MLHIQRRNPCESLCIFEAKTDRWLQIYQRGSYDSQHLFYGSEDFLSNREHQDLREEYFRLRLTPRPGRMSFHKTLLRTVMKQQMVLVLEDLMPGFLRLHPRDPLARQGMVWRLLQGLLGESYEDEPDPNTAYGHYSVAKRHALDFNQRLIDLGYVFDCSLDQLAVLSGWYKRPPIIQKYDRILGLPEARVICTEHLLCVPAETLRDLS